MTREREKSRIELLLEFLTDPEEQVLTLCGRNPDFDGPNYRVEFVRFDVAEQAVVYDGDDLLDCLEKAARDQENAEILFEELERIRAREMGE